MSCCQMPHSRFDLWPLISDLVFDLVTLRLCSGVELVHFYLPFEYGDDRRSLRSSNAHFKVWPLTPYIWSWGSKLKNAQHLIFVYGLKEHSSAFIARSYQNCRSSRKYVKIYKKQQWPWWPCYWSCDFEVVRVCWPCTSICTYHLNMVIIWGQ